MSYDIYIGNAVPVHEKDEDGFYASWEVEEVTLDEAPSFEGDEMTGKGNGRHPGYSQWGNFCDAAGLSGMFFGKDDGILAEHPGCVHLTTAHLETVRAALKRWKARHKAPPGFGDGLDGVLARLIWLEWWMAWALANCETPAVSNR